MDRPARPWPRRRARGLPPRAPRPPDARARRRLRRTRPRDLADAASLHWQPARRRAIPLAAIVGTVEATADFDAELPAGERARGLALAQHRARPSRRPPAPPDRRDRADGRLLRPRRPPSGLGRACPRARRDRGVDQPARRHDVGSGPSRDGDRCREERATVGPFSRSGAPTETTGPMNDKSPAMQGFSMRRRGLEPPPSYPGPGPQPGASTNSAIGAGEARL